MNSPSPSARPPKHGCSPAVRSLLDRGTTEEAKGRVESAIQYFENAIRIDPDCAAAFCRLGSAYWQLGRPAEAAAMWLRATELEPGEALAHTHLGVALRSFGRLQEAEAAHRQALRLDPGLASAHANLGVVLRDQSRFAESEAAVAAAVALDGSVADYYMFLGTAIANQGRIHEGIAALRKGLALRPDLAELHKVLALTLLKGGYFREGWQEFEWRWKHIEKPRSLPFPSWNGQELNGRTILLHTERVEQGLGDVLQFVRYAGLLAGRGAHVVVEAPEPLRRLLATARGVAEVVTDVDAPRGPGLPAFDYHLPMMTAPHLFETVLESIPAEVPYVFGDAVAVAAWARHLRGLKGLKVGLAWSGKALRGGLDRRRSVALATLAPLMSVAGVSMVSLQWDSEAKQIADLPRRLRPLDRMAEVSDLADTAALVTNLDLVISIDTSVAHLAGALGKPVWILLRSDACWRWLLDRADSPWYPTARLFRQTVPGDWDGLVRRVATALTEEAGKWQRNH